jgi:hypothetical protein
MTTSATKTTGWKPLFLGLALAAGLMANVTAHAAEKDAPTAIPASSAAIWQAVDTEMDAMSKMIQAGTIADLHHHAFAVRDLVAALPAHSDSLPADKLESVRSSSKFVATLTDRLDAAGDGNDKTAAASNLTKLQTVLKSIRENYPDSNSKQGQ